jgi:hypothetical protein
MNTYSKFVANVFLAKCTEKHEKGETIKVTTRKGKDNESIVHNLIYEKDGFFFYSITRADGYNLQERAKKKAENYKEWSASAEKKSDSSFNASNQITSNIPMGQPILRGHHSQRRHERDLERSWNLMGKSVEFAEKAKDHVSKAEYWAARANDINLSMPESIEFYEFQLEKAKEKHEGLKSGTIPRDHSFSLPYAKKEVNELENKFALAKKLWQ